MRPLYRISVHTHHENHRSWTTSLAPRRFILIPLVVHDISTANPPAITTLATMAVTYEIWLTRCRFVFIASRATRGNSTVPLIKSSARHFISESLTLARGVDANPPLFVFLHSMFAIERVEDSGNCRVSFMFGYLGGKKDFSNSLLCVTAHKCRTTCSLWYKSNCKGVLCRVLRIHSLRRCWTS